MNRRPYYRSGSGRGTSVDTPATSAVYNDREAARNRVSGSGLQWKKMDLHLHTPASSDYRDPGISYLDILKKAEEKGLDLIAFADHNTVSGYAAMHEEVETLTLLERLKRATPDELAKLAEYRRLLAKIVVLPAFEFTATFGFHILGVFPENTSVRKLEYLLLNLNVPEERMLIGAPDVGSTSDVLNAYASITQAGGLAIAAHANSSNGVAMQGFPFGGQTKIAYTQDSNLVALEVTDLESTSRRSTAFFYNSSKPEYPRRMHCIQGSDAHSLDTEQSDSNNKRLGVGARVTEILVKDASFAALKEVLTSTDFSRTRPFRSNVAWEAVESARLIGATSTQTFHERAVTPTSRTRPVLHDVIAFANGEGGTLYIGISPDSGVPIQGLFNAQQELQVLADDIERMIEPDIDVDIQLKQDGDRGIIVVRVPSGTERPYIFKPAGQIYVRSGVHSMLASRSQMIDLVMQNVASDRSGARSQAAPQQPQVATPTTAQSPPPIVAPTTGGQTREARDLPRDRRAEQNDRTRGTREGRSTSAFPATSSQPTPQPALPESVSMPSAAPQPSRVPPRLPALQNLPPEKIKGQVRPMFQPEPATQSASPQAQPAVEEPVVPTSEISATAEASVEALPAPQTEEPSQKPRSRSRRKPAQASLSENAQTLPQPVSQPTIDTPMEATVSAEHLTREEIVAAEKPKRRRGRRTPAEEARLEVEAPAAAAAATEAGMEAILVDAEMQPTLEASEPLPVELPQPERKGRSRRRSSSAQVEVAQDTTQRAEIPAPADIPPTEPGVPEAPSKGRRRSRKAGASATPEASVQPGSFEPVDPPATGVEITGSVTRENTIFHTMHNLTDNSTVHNVTRRSTRGLWHYAVIQQEHGLPAMSEVFWHPQLPVGLWRQEHRAGAVRYDLVARQPDGSLRIFYGVTADGVTGTWQDLVRQAEEAGYEGPPAPKE
ncbi:MAG: putative DNA binding domain-containing protein [Chloroflexota bacterium]|nr:putative DNA binding domain-containing protein [Chloroflexota bacterium]